MSHSISFRVLVCGGRSFSDRDGLNRVLDELHSTRRITHLIQGGATGADALARDWATRRGVICSEYRAHWNVYGRQAGAKRNLQMLLLGHPDQVVAFPGQEGTRDMIRQARARSVPVRQVPIESPA